LSASDVIEVVGALGPHGLNVWIDGGWGVDALVGEQTRDHADLDVAADRRDLAVTIGGSRCDA
jgi:lincosamide nucleotidyltransferase A/C/D/E